MTVSFEEAKKRVYEEACGDCGTYGTTATTLGHGDMPAHIIPYLVWNEINLYPPRRRVFMRAFLQTNILVGAAGTEIYVPVYGRDEFTASQATEYQIDHEGYQKTKPSPDEVKICIGDVIYNATKISDILREDSPTLGWLRASLQMMGWSIQQRMETDMEGALFAGGVAGGNVVGAAVAGVLSYADIIDVKALMSAASFYNMGQPFLLYINPEQEADLLKEFGPDRTSGTDWAYAHDVVPAGAQVGQPIASSFQLVAGCIPLVTENMRDNFAIVVIPPNHPFGPAAIWAWKRPLKMENWRGSEAQYGRDVWLLSTRYGCAVKRNEAVGLISNC